jgi:folate-dependent phosphoribosylglycinamide formyltransferase PurN
LYEIVGVIASRPDCGGVGIARELGLPLLVADFRRAAQEAVRGQVDEFLSACRANWVALAGFLKVFPDGTACDGRVVNIHPALLPKHGGQGMYGHYVHEAVIAANDPTSGATVHFVTQRYDEGAIIAQAIVPVTVNDTAEALSERVFAAECFLYPEVLDGLVNGRLPLSNGDVMRVPHGCR